MFRFERAAESVALSLVRKVRAMCYYPMHQDAYRLPMCRTYAKLNTQNALRFLGKSLDEVIEDVIEDQQEDSGCWSSWGRGLLSYALPIESEGESYILDLEAFEADTPSGFRFEWTLVQDKDVYGPVIPEPDGLNYGIPF